MDPSLQRSTVRTPSILQQPTAGQASCCLLSTLCMALYRSAHQLQVYSATVASSSAQPSSHVSNRHFHLLRQTSAIQVNEEVNVMVHAG